MPYNIMVLGSGGREHTIAWKLSQSPDCGKIYSAPGNAGTAGISTNLPIAVSDFERISEACLEYSIDILVVGPEVPLVEGIADYFASDARFSDLKVIGPSSAGARLEGSKDFAKVFMHRHGVPTAAYRSFTKAHLMQAVAFLDTLSPPYVIKADGLAAGKGVLILDEKEEAARELDDILNGSKFNEAGNRVVIEEFLDGIELSCFVWVKGGEYRYLPFAKDYKRIGEGDTGLNTGGMGAVSPVPFLDEGLKTRIEERVVRPTVKGMQEDGIDYHGFLFIGLMVVNGDPFVIEYNVRLGDPETEVILPRLRDDLLPIMAAEGFEGIGELDIDPRFACTVIAVSGGYPGSYERGKVITGLNAIHEDESLLFHAGTQQEGDRVLTSGGRVLALTSFGDDMEQALNKSYASMKQIAFEGMGYRTDIGFDLR